MHKQFLLIALQQAWLGRGSCAPNPSVGAVLVSNNQIIASDWHKGAGTAHAEQLVLQHCPKDVQDLTLYVTLEPCNHWGKTPPCVSAIINSGVRRVVYGFRDPNPMVVANDSPRLLREQGIEVIHFPLPEIDSFYQSYQFWTRTKKPWVTAKLAQTLDGKIAGAGGKPIMLSNESCSRFTHNQRLRTDVILTTARTIIQDNPALNARISDEITSKPVAILDRNLVLTSEPKLWTTASHCQVFHDAALEVDNPRSNCRYHAIPVTNGELDLLAVVSQLGQLGYHDVWVEAGGRLFSALHEQGLVHRTYLYLVPKTLGEDAVPAYHGSHFFDRKHTMTWQAQDDNMIACLDWQEGTCLQA